MQNNYQISGKSTTLKYYADVYDTIEHIKRIVSQNYRTINQLAYSLQSNTQEKTLNNIWDFVRTNIKYKNDEPGKEQLRTPQRTLHDKTGDCDDMSILISSILMNLNFAHNLIIAAYKNKNQWQHIYPIAYDSNGNEFVLDCVPEIPRFNYQAQPIKNQIVINMQLEELGRLQRDQFAQLTEPFNIDSLEGISDYNEDILSIQGLLGKVILVDQDQDFDTVISGYELKENIILKQLVQAKEALLKEISNPTDISQYGDSKTDLELINNIINNFSDSINREQAINQAIAKNTMYGNFYKAIAYGLEDVVSGLMGDDDDDTYYLKVINDDTLLHKILSDDEISGIGDLGLLKKLRAKVKTAVTNLKEKHPKLAKIGRALNKYNPATFALRKSMEAFLRANVFRMGEKLAIGYATEAQARAIGYTKADWDKFVSAKNAAEAKWYALGGDKSYFIKMVQNSGGAKKAGLQGELGVLPAVISAVTSAFGAVVNVFKNLKLKKKDGTEVDDNDTTPLPSPAIKSPIIKSRINNTQSENMEKIEIDEKSGVSTEVIIDENGSEKKIYKDSMGNEISRYKALFLKHKKMIMIISIITVIGIIGLIIWKIRQSALNGLGAAELSKKQENYIKRQGLNNRAYASLVREEINKDGQKYNASNRKQYYKKVFQDAFSRPLSQKQVTSAKNYNDMYRNVRELAKAKGGGSDAWRQAWAEIKKKRIA